MTWRSPLLVPRFWDQLVVDLRTGCWVWCGSRTRDGYGQIGVRCTTLPTHRYTFHNLARPIPPGYQVDHLCPNKACCNPRHLDLVTPAENIRRRDERRKIRDKS